MSELSAIGYARYAKEFSKAATATDDTLGMENGFEEIAPVPVMYLRGHSIELILKAYLIHNSANEKQLRSIGHDLIKCHKKAKELGLNSHIELSNGDIKALTALSKLYKSKQLNYMVKGYKNFPVMGPLETLNRNLLATISPLVGYA